MPELHQITLETIDEAAAFVAALTRQLAAPGVDVHSASTEVAVAVRGTGAEVYLSPHALAASERALGAAPSTRVVGSLPNDSVAIVTPGAIEPLGRDDILRRLTALPE